MCPGYRFKLEFGDGTPLNICVVAGTEAWSIPNLLPTTGRQKETQVQIGT